MSYFWDTIEKYGEKVALISEEEAISYAKLAEISDRIAKDISSRSLAFIVCSNEIASIAGYLACLRKRVVVALINSSIDDELFEKLLGTYRPQFIWCPKDFLDEPGTISFGNYKLVVTGNLPYKVNDELAVLVTTSGSTGSPKYVRLSYRNIESNTKAIVEFLGIVSSDRAITTLPMSYVYGLSIIQSHLFVGASVIVTERSFFDVAFWDFFKRVGATTFGSVPYLYKMLVKMRFLSMDLPSLKYITQAGGKLDKNLHFRLAKGMDEKGKRFYAMYGATEATARISYVPYEMSAEKAGSVGIAIPGGRLELVDANGKVITESGKAGDLVYYGPNVMMGYAQGTNDLLKGDEMQGRLVTGDVAKRDADGYYYIVGRRNRFVKVFGHRVNLVELEELLDAHGYETACVGDDDHIRIYTTSGRRDEIIDFLHKKTGLNATAFTVIWIERIPRNDAGKVEYWNVDCL